MEFNDLSGKQRAVAQYLYDRRGKVISFQELLTNLWSEYSDADASNRPNRRLVHLTIQKIRQKIPVNLIRSHGREGYSWAGPTMGDNGHSNIQEMILSSAGDLDGSISIARLLKVADTYVIQLRQTQGTKAQTVNLNFDEYMVLNRFISANT